MKLRVTVEGRTYEVEVEIVDEGGRDEPPAMSAAPPPVAPVAHPAPVSQPPSAPSARKSASPPPPSADGAVCRSPMRGTINAIKVAVGQSVRRNDVLLVLEAMKMESNIPSPRDGVVRVIHVSTGQNVREGDVLLEFE